ncbi:hypothetical protein ACP4OV_013954 [Aristida adscensionis]
MERPGRYADQTGRYLAGRNPCFGLHSGTPDNGDLRLVEAPGKIVVWCDASHLILRNKLQFRGTRQVSRCPG